MLSWLVANWSTLVELALALVGAASLVTGLTKSPEDDKVVSKVQRFVSRFGVTTWADAPGSLKTPGMPAEQPLILSRESLKLPKK